MAKKSELLELLGRDELLGVLDAHELSVDDRGRKDLLIAAMAQSKAAQPADFLLEPPRDRLKDLCWQLGLDDAGRAKADLAERLTGGAAGAASGAPPDPAEAKKKPGLSATKKGAAKTAPGKENQSALGFEAQLWAAADLLRNNMDLSEYEHVVLGLIFLKYRAGQHMGLSRSGRRRVWEPAAWEARVLPRTLEGLGVVAAGVVYSVAKLPLRRRPRRAHGILNPPV